MSKKAAPVSTAVDISKDPLIGRQLGDYRLTSVLATGGMARIYKGTDVKLQRQAAIKVLAQGDVDADKTLTRRFEREARSVAALEHDNIITIYQYNQQDGVYFLAMKLVKGKDLAQELKRLKKSGHKMDVARALLILEQVASALDYAHSAGVIHRDIKPSNILLDENDKAVLTDFGLVLRKTSETTMGTAFGTPRYIAPEQAISSNKAVPQSDIYALGVILYEILTGETPFTGESPMEIALSHISDPPPSPRSRNPDIPAAAERELLRALEKEPEKRPTSAQSFIQAIKNAYGLTADPAVVTPTKPGETMASVYNTPAVAPPSIYAPKHAADASAKGRKAPRKRLLLLLVVLVVVAAAIGAAYSMLNLQGGAANGAPITLIYDESSFFMVNGGDYTLGVLPLQFIRGTEGDRDDFTGDNITRDQLPAKSCAMIALQSQQQNNAPAQCETVHSRNLFIEPKLLFWRRETPDNSLAPTFEIRYKGNVIARCDTLARGSEPKECRFNWPVTAEEAAEK